jgi:hypothetical protein
VIECNDELAIKSMKSSVVKPGQLVMTILEGGLQFLGVSQMNTLQVFNVGKEIQLIKEIQVD